MKKNLRFDIISVQPELMAGPFDHSIVKRAIEKGMLEVFVHDLREFGLGRHKQVDDYQFGGGSGMVLMVEPIAKCIESLQSQRKYDEIIFMTPDGKRFEQSTANKLSLKNNIIILAGHYKGIDERIRENYITMELSIGDFVLSGGELPAAMVVDAVGRLIPGVLGDETSALSDSFQDNLLAPPVYTRPKNYKGWEAPEILFTGNHKKIEEWRMEQAIKRTKERRPDIFEKG